MLNELYQWEKIPLNRLVNIVNNKPLFYFNVTNIPYAWSYLVRVCVILINRHISHYAVMCVASFFSLLKSIRKNKY